MNFQNHFFLYVEDDESSRTVMELMMHKVLKTKNYMFFSETTNFIERIKQLPVQPTIILLDIHMKPKDGFALLDMLRADKDYERSKIIALTASVMNEEIQQLRRRGFDGAIGKPIKLTTFPYLIERIISGESIWSVS